MTSDDQSSKGEALETTTTEPDEVPEADTTDDATTDDAADTDDATPARGNEAAKYRVERNQARAALAEARTQIENLQRAAVEDICAAASVTPRALWTVAELGDLVDQETGTVDRNAVTKAIAKAREELGIATVGKGAHVPNAGKMPTTPPATDRWSDAFSPKNRRR